MIGDTCDRCGHTPKNPSRSLFYSAMTEQTTCIDGMACLRRVHRRPARQERWMVVDKNRTAIFTGFYSKDRAQAEAEVLNESGLVEFRPYRVVEDVVTESVG